jgi:hypothetical protein
MVDDLLVYQQKGDGVRLYSRDAINDLQLDQRITKMQTNVNEKFQLRDSNPQESSPDSMASRGLL